MQGDQPFLGDPFGDRGGQVVMHAHAFGTESIAKPGSLIRLCLYWLGRVARAIL